MPMETLIFGYVAALLGGLAGYVLYAEHQRKRFTPSQDPDRIFRCEKCGFVYTDDPDVDRSRCSSCGALNEAIKF